MQCIVYLGPQRPGSGGAPNHLAPALVPPGTYYSHVRLNRQR